jgi:hypothetical protein
MTEEAKFQKLFERNEKEIIKCLIDETKELYDKLEALEKRDKQYKDILDQILREFPVGNIAEHTIESLPERISYYLKELAEYTQKVEAWEKCAQNLVDYAHEFVHQLSLWGKGYDRNDKQIKLAEDAIEEYNRLKNETKPNE